MFGIIQFTNTCVRECSLDLVFRPLYATCRKSWNKCELKIMYYIYYRIFSVRSAEESYEYKFEIYMEYVSWAHQARVQFGCWKMPARKNPKKIHEY